VFMLEQRPEHGLLKELVNRILYDTDQGIKGHATEILEQLLNPETMDQAQEKNQFLETFYGKFLESMITVFEKKDIKDTNKMDEGLDGQDHCLLNVARNHVCELLTFFVQNHGYRIKYFVLRNNIVRKVCDLMRVEERYIALSAVRFVRACVGLKDEFYFRYMVKNNSFKPMVDLFNENGGKYNLLNSSIIEMFEFIRKENIKSLLKYVTDQFGDLRQISYVDTFSGLWTQHEKNSEFAKPGSPGMVHTDGSSAAAAAKAADADEEEMYFDRDDDSADNAATDVAMTLQSTGGLVAYDDEDGNDGDDAADTPSPGTPRPSSNGTTTSAADVASI